MAVMDEILQKAGLKFDDLTIAERDTLFDWSKSLQSKQLTVGSIKSYIQSMRFSVERELTETGHNSKQDILLKGRLRNYMLLEAYLESPEKAKVALDQALAGIISNKGEK